MQIQSADPFCLNLQLGRISMISMPSDYLPRRVDWAKWMDCIASGVGAFGQKFTSSPRISLSPDHLDPKDNIAITSLQGQGGLENIDLPTMFSEAADGARFLLAGSWFQPTPSWFSSMQSVFGAKYSAVIPDQLTHQMRRWAARAESAEKSGFFLVTDDLGRLAALTSISKNWRSRQIRSGVLVEARSPSWCASIIEIHRPNSSEGQAMRLHRIAVIEPGDWCGSPRIDGENLTHSKELSESAELWISSPAVGLSLWIADQFHHLETCASKLIMPSSILGWHPIRDMVGFLGQAPSGSLLYLVDQFARLQILKKELGASS